MAKPSDSGFTEASPRNRRLIAFALLIMFVLGGATLLAPLVAILLGVPPIIAFRFLPIYAATFRLSGIQSLQLHVDINPNVGLYVGERIHVLVTDNQTRPPVEQASLHVETSKTNMGTLLTSIQGRADFDYPGETTILYVSKIGYDSQIRVLPQFPPSWLLSEIISYVFSGLVSLAGVIWYTRKRLRSPPRALYG